MAKPRRTNRHQEGKTYHNRSSTSKSSTLSLRPDRGRFRWRFVVAGRHGGYDQDPKWIDLDLVGPHGDKSKLYGTYEFADGQLKLALGTTGKRALRPLELKPDKTYIFDVKIAKEPLGTVKLLPASTTPAKELPSGRLSAARTRLPSIESRKSPDRRIIERVLRRLDATVVGACSHS